MYKLLTPALLLLPSAVCAQTVADIARAEQAVNQAQNAATNAQTTLTNAETRLRMFPSSAATAPTGARPTPAQKTQAEARLRASETQLTSDYAASVTAAGNLANFRRDGDPANPDPGYSDPAARMQWVEQKHRRVRELEVIQQNAHQRFLTANTAKHQAETALLSLNDRIRQFEDYEKYQRAAQAVTQAQQAKINADAELASRRQVHQDALNAATAGKNTALVAAQNALNKVDQAFRTEEKRALENVNQRARNEANIWKARYELDIQRESTTVDVAVRNRQIDAIKAAWQQQVQRINQERLGNYQSLYNQKIERARSILRARRDALNPFNGPPFADVPPVMLLLNDKIAGLREIRTARLTPLDLGSLSIAAPRIISFTGRWTCKCPSIWTLNETGRTAGGDVTYSANVRKGDWSMSIAGAYNARRNELVMIGTATGGHRVRVILNFRPRDGKLVGDYYNLTDSTRSGEELER